MYSRHLRVFWGVLDILRPKQEGLRRRGCHQGVEDFEKRLIGLADHGFYTREV
jgi:hypothetical protein